MIQYFIDTSIATTVNKIITSTFACTNNTSSFLHNASSFSIINFFFAVIDDGSLTDEMLYEIINNLTKSDDKPSNDSAGSEMKGECKLIRDGSRMLIGRGGGAYSYIQVLLDFSRAEPEYMNMHPPPN